MLSLQIDFDDFKILNPVWATTDEQEESVSICSYALFIVE